MRPLPPDPGSSRVIGDGRTAALITPTAEIDWWCGPELDSTPVLWSLLDATGGAARWTGVIPVDTTGPVASPAQETLVRLEGDRIRCVDGFVLDDDGRPTLVRLVRAVDHPLELVHELSAGGFDSPRASWVRGGDVFEGVVAGHRVCVASTGCTEIDGPWLRTTVAVGTDAWSCLLVGFGDLPPLDADELHARLQAARDRAEQAVQEALIPSSYSHRVRDALRVLHACTWSSSGAVVASLTTSLPEAPGADRQFDYRYTWLRDASLAVSVASLLGQSDVARRFLSFARATVADDPRETPPLVTVRGTPAPEEREVPGVSGWADSQPVRVGNGAAGQRQYDALGLLVEAVSVHLQTGGRLDSETWDVVTRIADAIAAEVLAGEHPPSSGIWELRRATRLVNDDVGRWVVLDRAVQIARVLRPWHRRRHWIRAREQVRERVLSVLGDDGSLPQSYDDEGCTPDASALAAAVFGLVDGDDPRAARLVDWVLDRLGAEELVHRYPPALPGQQGQDGFCGREGTFLPMAFWAVAALAAVGEVDRAERRLVTLDRRLPRLLSEQIDPTDGRSLGNAPLLWSHMALARAVYILKAARLRRRYGELGLTVWRVGRFVRLRGLARS